MGPSSILYCIPSAESRDHNELINSVISGYILYASCGIQAWDLSVFLYLNLKHGDLDCSATTAGLNTYQPRK